MSAKVNNKPLITFQTGQDESYLIGTKAQLIDFANEILKAVETAKPSEFFGESALVSNTIHGSLDNKAEINIDEVVIVKNNDIKDALFYKIYNS